MTLNFLTKAKHKKIEIFGMGLGAVLLAMTLVIGSIGIKTFYDNRERVSAQAIYTTNFNTSVSNNSGTVTGVYANKAKTRSLIFIKWSDVSAMSTDAHNYRVRLLSERGALKHIPQYSSIYFFGSTGYMGIYFEDSQGFDKCIYRLTLRCDSVLKSNDDVLSDEETTGQSAKFDEAYITYNAAADDVQYLDALEDNKINPCNFYRDAVSIIDDTEKRKAALETLSSMKEQLNYMSEYEDRLFNAHDMGDDRQSSAKLKYQEPPKQIKDDEIVKKDNLLYLKSSYTIAKGYDFNWQDSSIKKGYSQLMGITDLKQELLKHNNSSDASDRFDVNDIVWYKSDGSAFNLNESYADMAEESSIKSDILELTNAWKKYYDLKTTYQTVNLVDLLRVELSLQEVELNYTACDSMDSFFFV